jgi:hypothetical protein
LIKRWSSVKDIVDTFGYNKSGIASCCRGITKSAYGFVWRYEGEKQPEPVYDGHNKKKVLQYDLNAILVATHPTIREASNATGVPYSGINSCCRGEFETASKFIWRFEGSDIPVKPIQIIDNIKVKQFDSSGNYIKTWSCASEAAKFLNIITGSIHKNCRGESKLCDGFIWKYQHDKTSARPTQYHMEIFQYTLDGVLMKKWNDVSDIEKELRYARYQIRSCCRGDFKYAYGYVWVFISNKPPLFPVSTGISILQCDMQNNVIKKWGNLKAASKESGVSKHRILKACKEEIDSAGGFIWTYTNKQTA